MKCEEMLKMLNEYVDGEIDPGVCEEFEAHLKDCDPCQVVIDNIRRTITLYKEDAVFEIPITFRNRLHSALKDRWKEKHPPTA
ncbi:MAG TPA: zf-HC2 domain-containing protein [Acidobacteriota bacterium]|nr:zf-HC2 domain-containing protein [Acidobacteriota bacterium]